MDNKLGLAFDAPNPGEIQDISETPHKLQLRLILPAQALKHLTHHEALVRFDSITQLSVIAFEATTPPVSPNTGDTYALGSETLAGWAGQGGDIVSFTNGG